MVQSFNLLRNIGKFDNVTVGAQLPFTRLTVIYADNARGKTTLAAVLRSLATGRPDLVTERARLGATDPPHIVIDTGTAPHAVFQNGAWSRTAPDITIFDDVFVAENVCSGIEVAATHRQNLHELIIGSQGIALADALQREVDQVEVHNRLLREREAAIPVTFRGRFAVEAFCALAAVPNLSEQVEEASKRLAAARESSKVAETGTFPSLALPKIDLDTLRTLLSKGIDDLDNNALSRVQAHLNSLGRGGETWVAEGMALSVDLELQGHDECPFCVQSLQTSPILAHYRAYFGEAYVHLNREIANAVRQFRSTQSGDVPAAFERNVRELIQRQGFWKDFTTVPAIDIDTATIARTWKVAREHVERVLEAKSQAPLDAVTLPADVEQAITQHNTQCERIHEISEQLSLLNPQLETVKEQARDANVATLTSDLNDLRAVEMRYRADVIPLCQAYLDEKTAKALTEQRRTLTRNALDQHRQTAFPAYGVAINDFLQRFNANFRVGPLDPTNIRGGSTANYTLLVDNNQVPLTGGPGTPSFRNTLSAGDRNTLALAFFFASLQQDPQRSQKVVVIDDPMTSLDEHRTLHTLQEIDRLSREVVRVVILSHSKPFLLGVWDKCRQLPRTSLEVRRSGAGSILATWDVISAMLTEHDRRHAAASAYLVQADPIAERRVAESLRLMLEAFCRVAYPADFSPGTMLGQFHQYCATRAGAPREIMSTANAQELRALLDYANRFHHDTNTAYATEIINDTELTDFTRRTLAFIRR